MTVSLDVGIQMRCGKLHWVRTNRSLRKYSFLLVQFRSSILKKYFMNVQFCWIHPVCHWKQSGHASGDRFACWNLLDKEV